MLPGTDSIYVKTKHGVGAEAQFELLSWGLDQGFPFEPLVYLISGNDEFGKIAHVTSFGDVCIGTSQSFNVDYDNPEAVAIAGLKKAVEIVSKGLSDPEWNTAELISEFQPMWQRLSQSGQRLFCIAEPGELPQRLHCLSEKKGATGWRDKARIVHGENPSQSINNWIWRLRAGRNEKGKGLLIPLERMMPPPAERKDIASWIMHLFNVQSSVFRQNVRDVFRRNKSKELIIVFFGNAKDGPIWFALLCSTPEKIELGLSPEELSKWKFEPLLLETPISKNRLLPRGGANTGLNNAKVCVIGCGSVGGYVADQLASSGVCNLHLIDGEDFRTENVHRHILDARCIGVAKSLGLRKYLEEKYPFLVCTDVSDGFEVNDGVANLEEFDLVILTTGNMTLERRITEAVYDLVKPPMLVSAWVEAYGLGGHAALTIPGKEGCLSCVFRDEATGQFSLHPKLSFIEEGQYVVTRHAGCGFEYISYSNVDAIQTAVVATRLGINGLLGEYPHGISLSWRGADLLAHEHSVNVSERYKSNEGSLTELPLYTGGCDVCQ